MILALFGSLDPEHLIQTFGTIGLIAIVFAESGLLFGFFLPGDSLLFTAGLLASQGKLNIAVILLGCFLAAVLGDQVGYATGRRMGPAMFKRPDSKIFKKQHVEKAQDFFDRHGPKTILLARFVPVVRTFAPIIAGVSHMDYKTFFRWNIVGGFLWAVGVTMIGYVFGSAFPGIEDYLLPAAAVIVVLSLLPVLIEVRKARREAARAAAEIEATAPPEPADT